MTVNLPSDIEASIRENGEGRRFADEADVIRAAMNLLDRQERLDWLKAALAEGKRGEPIEFTYDLMNRLIAEADENSVRGKPIFDAVKP